MINSNTYHLRLWHGFRRLENGAWDKFVADLADTFVPATWQVMRHYGLLSYVPTLLPENQGRGMPDEIALLVYRDEAGYKTSKNTVAGRAYSKMHAALFDFIGAASGSAIPVPWDNNAPQPRNDPASAWYRLASSGRSTWLTPDANATVHVVAFTYLENERRPTRNELATAVAPADAELALLLAPSYGVLWHVQLVPAEEVTPTQSSSEDLANRLLALGCRLICSHRSEPRQVMADDHDAFAGVSFTTDQSLRFLVATDQDLVDG